MKPLDITRVDASRLSIFQHSAYPRLCGAPHNRGFCPSCGGRRMAERAAHLVDHVFPDVPVRQCRGPQRGSRAGVEWVLSLPYRVRYRLAWDHDLCRAVVAVFLCAVLGSLRARARWRGVTDGRGGAVAIVQRFGGALNLNDRKRYLA